MDRMMYDALPATFQKASPLLGRPELPDVLLATIHTSMNGAYVYPETDYAHELLTAGAWLGVTLTGRTALMPSSVGDVLLSYLGRSQRPRDPCEQRIVRILEYYSEQIGGADRLIRAARRAVVKSSQIFTSLRAHRGPDAPDGAIWNPALAVRIDAFLDAAGLTD